MSCFTATAPAQKAVRSALVAGFALLVLSPSDGRGEDETLFWVEEGRVPRVHCGVAAQMSALEMWHLLQRPFEVYDESGLDCHAEAERRDDDPPPPIVIGGGGIIPIAPYCQCPETMIGTLERRLEQVRLHRLEAGVPRVRADEVESVREIPWQLDHRREAWGAGSPLNDGQGPALLQHYNPAAR